MREEDIEISLNSEVKEIIFDNKKAIGIKLRNNKEFFSDIVVFNGDPTHAYLNMIPKAREMDPKKLINWNYLWVCLLFFLGQKKNILK